MLCSKLVLVLTVMWLVSTEEGCNKRCRDFYYNCDTGAIGLDSDKPDEVIDCEQNRYKLRCPVTCNACTPCDFEKLFENVKEELETLKEEVEQCGCEKEVKYASEESQSKFLSFPFAIFMS